MVETRSPTPADQARIIASSSALMPMFLAALRRDNGDTDSEERGHMGYPLRRTRRPLMDQPHHASTSDSTTHTPHPATGTVTTRARAATGEQNGRTAGTMALTALPRDRRTSPGISAGYTPPEGHGIMIGFEGGPPAFAH